MSKNIDDIIPPERRSIRKVSMSRVTRRKRPMIMETDSEKDIYLQSKPPRSRRSYSGFGIWIISFVSILLLIFGFSFLFSGAKLVITPKQRTVLVDAQFNAYKNPGVNELGYEIMTVEKEGFKEVNASGVKFVEEKASGVIVVYNDYSSSSQRLIKNTRFKTPEGLIYRINESITVPGQKKDGTEVIPGSIEVTVYADEVGESYNIGLTDFSIPGFEGDPRFESFYARSKTPMVGGFSGEKKMVSESDESRTRIEIQEELKIQLMKDIFTQKPEGFEIYEDSIFVTFTSLQEESNDNKVSLGEKATLYGVLFDKSKFAQFIARNTVAGFEEEVVEIVDTSSLSFLINDKESAKPWEKDSFSFNLKGNAHIVWSFKSEQLKEDLSGKAKGALQTVLTGYPSVDEAQIVLRPFWRQTFPVDIKDIKIITIIEK